MSFQVGDTVVVTEKVKNCIYSCNEEMKEMIGKEFVVKISDPGRNYYILVQWY